MCVAFKEQVPSAVVCAALSQTAVCYVNPVSLSEEKGREGKALLQSALPERGGNEGRAAAFYFFFLFLFSPPCCIFFSV